MAPSASFTECLIAGGLAGTSVDVALYPLDVRDHFRVDLGSGAQTIKTRLQATEGFRQAGGFQGVYRGLGSVVVGSAPSAALFFAAYEQAKILLPRLVPALDRSDAAAVLHMISASLGEVSACLVRVPTEVVKQRQQTAAYGRVGTFTALQRVIAESGPSGLYRGFSSTVAREFPLYEALKSSLAARRHQHVAALPSWQAALCGSLSGAIAAALTCPFDVAKTRIMLDRRVGARPPAIGVYGTISRIARTEGVSALWKGVVPRVIWLSLGGAVFLGVYEAAKGAMVGQRAD